ncbi:MAG: DMT family transporter [Luteibacter sp.]|uniref:DMT family transporter n=1 Tax=Luteibacter TaxID=242605 RepID=UPI00068F16DA|nr:MULTISPECIES: DMT family transporter [unclassified Luteibacter]MDQ7994776.1 DMT family transporter [Luteibacter sp.]
MRRSLVRGMASGAAAGALWGTVFLVPAVLNGFSPFELSIGRYVAYGLVSAVVLGVNARPLMRRLDRSAWWGLVWLSLSGNLVYYLLLAFAVQSAGGAATSLIVGLVPVVVAVVARHDADAIPMRRLAPALALSVTGVALIAYSALSAQTTQVAPWPTRLLGLVCAVGALLSWSAYSIGNARWLTRRHDLGSHEWSLLTGLMTGALSLLLVPVALAVGTPAHDLEQWWLFVGMSMGVALFASVLGNAFWNRASRLLPLSLSGQMIVFETLAALLYSFLWHRRWPDALEWAAIALLVAGIVQCARVHRGALPQTQPGNNADNRS